MLATQVLDDEDLPKGQKATDSNLATQVLDDDQKPNASSKSAENGSAPEPAVLEKSNDVPEKAEDVQIDPAAIPGGGLNIDSSQDPKEKAKKRAAEAESSPAKDLIKVRIATIATGVSFQGVKFGTLCNIVMSIEFDIKVLSSKANWRSRVTMQVQLSPVLVIILAIQSHRHSLIGTRLPR